jgi:acyl carrier protein
MTDDLDDKFCGCRPETIAAIRAYRTARNPDLVAPIFRGIVEKYSPENQPPPPSWNAVNVFGLESLALMEMVLDVQDALGIVLQDAELRGLQSIDDAMKLLMQKVAALEAK